ncbi:MFS transporter [Candidatus Woesearchaeota archaeon]|nr:MFS transporter [Candidatus Woesearchaeota archaeon]
MYLSRDQRNILRESSFYAIYSSLTLSLIVPFALALGASNVFIGFLTAAQFLAIMLAQIPGERAVERVGKRVVFFATTTLARLLWMVILLVPIYFGGSLGVLLVFFFVINFLEYFAEPGYLTMIAEVVNRKTRAWFFATKNSVKVLFNTGCFFIAGYYLDLYPRDSTLGFSNLMLMGVIFAIIASYFMAGVTTKTEPRRRIHRIRDYFHLRPGFVRFMMFVVVFNFAVQLASPFITVYQLDHLALSYRFYAGLIVIAMVTRVLSQLHLAKICARYGEKPVAYISVALTALIPLVFLASDGRPWMLVAAHMLVGFAFAGADLTVINMLFHFTSDKDRSFYMSAYVVMAAAPLVVAPLLGGWIADNVAWVLGGIPLVFILSAVLRLFSASMLWRIPGKPKAPMGTVFLKMAEFHPEKGVHKAARLVRKEVKRFKW